DSATGKAGEPIRALTAWLSSGLFNDLPPVDLLWGKCRTSRTWSFCAGKLASSSFGTAPHRHKKSGIFLEQLGPCYPTRSARRHCGRSTVLDPSASTAVAPVACGLVQCCTSSTRVEAHEINEDHNRRDERRQIYLGALTLGTPSSKPWPSPVAGYIRREARSRCKPPHDHGRRGSAVSDRRHIENFALKEGSPIRIERRKPGVAWVSDNFIRNGGRLIDRGSFDVHRTVGTYSAGDVNPVTHFCPPSTLHGGVSAFTDRSSSRISVAVVGELASPEMTRAPWVVQRMVRPMLCD